MIALPTLIHRCEESQPCSFPKAGHAKYNFAAKGELRALNLTDLGMAWPQVDKISNDYLRHCIIHPNQ